MCSRTKLENLLNSAKLNSSKPLKSQLVPQKCTDTTVNSKTSGRKKNSSRYFKIGSSFVLFLIDFCISKHGRESSRIDSLSQFVFDLFSLRIILLISVKVTENGSDNMKFEKVDYFSKYILLIEFLRNQ